MAILINGKETSLKLREGIKSSVSDFVKERGYAPKLTVIVVGNDPASAVYVRNKHKACMDCGIESEIISLPEETKEAELLSVIERLNLDSTVNGILVQLPLPKTMSERAIINAIAPEKDVDAFGYESTGRISVGDYDFLPCTPAGVMALLDEYGIDPSGKECVVVGRSNIVGKPMAHLLMERNGTVTVCHSRTRDLSFHTKRADILVLAIGKAKFVTGDMIKEGAVVIDVGINRDSEGKLCGDADFGSCEKLAAAITPVPGGVGPMTITMLLENTVRAAKKQI